MRKRVNAPSKHIFWQASSLALHSQLALYNPRRSRSYGNRFPSSASTRSATPLSSVSRLFCSVAACPSRSSATNPLTTILYPFHGCSQLAALPASCRLGLQAPARAGAVLSYKPAVNNFSKPTPLHGALDHQAGRSAFAVGRRPVCSVALLQWAAALGCSSSTSAVALG